jgi:hypothetical protein
LVIAVRIVKLKLQELFYYIPEVTAEVTAIQHKKTRKKEKDDSCDIPALTPLLFGLYRRHVLNNDCRLL